MATSFAKIHLNLGGSVQELTLQGKEIIKKSKSSDYQQSFASAILFPFTGRIENGLYSFNNEKHQLFINDTNNNCALHGLVYNQTFLLIDEKEAEEFASVTLVYNSDGRQQGFPFKYSLFVTYTLTNTNLTTKIHIENTDEKSFPFSLGWHPYFYSEDLNNSSISFTNKRQAIFDEDLIVQKFIPIEKEINFQLKNTELDNCYEVDENNVYFTTSDYDVEITSSNFLQLYTSANRKQIAIEPMTAPGNSFNNKIGLQVLESKEEYNMTWEIKLIDKDI